MEYVVYNNRKLRFFGALVGSFILLLNGRWHLILKAFTSPSFYLAFAISFLVALLLVFAVHRFTLKLDQKWSWREEPVTRSLMQFLLALILPVLLDIGLMGIYFSVLGENILTNDFLSFDLPLVICLIGFLNVYYLIRYLIATEGNGTQTDSAITPSKIEIDKVPDEISKHVIHSNGLCLHLDVRTDVICFFRSGKKYFC